MNHPCPHWNQTRAASTVGVRVAAGLAALCTLAATARAVGGQTPGAVPDLSRWERGLVHEAWTTKDGLPVNSITTLLQSRDGYIWAGTFDGLVRFDGARFTVFNSTLDDDLPTNRFIRSFEGSDGTLWFATESILVRFRNNRFEHIGNDHGLTGRFLGWYEDRSGRVWVMTTNGLGRMEGDRFVVVLPEQSSGPVTRVIERRDGSIWAGTLRGDLYRLAGSPGGSTMEAVPVVALGTGRVHALFEDPSGRLWIGTWNGVWTEKDGLARVESDIPFKDVFEFVHSPRQNAVFAYSGTGIFRMQEGRAVAVDPRPRIVANARPIVVDTAGGLWYATGSEVGRDGRTVVSLGPDSDEQPSPTVITAMVIDHEGSVWIGTRAAGLHRVKPSFITTLSEPEGISYGNIYPIHQGPTGDIWIGTFGNGFNRIHPDGQITSYTPADGYPVAIYTLFADRIDRLWLGADGGIYNCRLPDVVCVRDEMATPGALPYAFYEDSTGRLWAGFSAGIMRREDGRWTVVPEWPGTGPVRAFAETPDGAIWMGTNGGGLVRYLNGALTRITAEGDGLPIDFVRSLYVDVDGWLWVGTEGRGLARLDPLAWSDGSGRTDRRIVSIRAANGLFDEVIHQILEDDAGRIWMSTNRGIFWVARDELIAFAEGRVDRVRSTGYTERDGLRNREANGGMQPVGIRARDGRLWFPTQDGVAIIDPADIETGRIPPPVVVERILAGDSVAVPGDSEFVFGVTQRDLQIDYTALSFLEPANVRFRYRLDPYDADWVDAGPRRTAFYTRVPPGRYTFRAMASNDPGVWAGEETAMSFRLLPRFRETRGALVLAILAFGLIGVAGYRWRVGNLRRRERELTQVVEMRTSDLRRNEHQLEERNTELAAQADMLAELHEARSRLFANLSHELRTPLTLIMGPLRSLTTGRHGALGQSVRDQHDLMLRNSERLLSLINQILDMSSLQAGGVSLELETADLVAFTRAMTTAFASLAEGRGVDLRFHSDLPQVLCAFDSGQLEKVLLNLLSNAVKFTERGGAVDVTVRGEATSAEIVVRDTGVGIDPEELPRVFERFYQADSSSTRRYAGTGIGLALARELVELHGGDIRAKSTLGVGSTFTVRLPMPESTAPAASTRTRSRNSGMPRNAAHLAVSTLPPADDALADPSRHDPPKHDTDSADDRTTVLVVDDNADVRAYVRSILEDSYLVIEARDGQEGLETALTALPDLIVADVMMPRRDGLALGRALKQDPLTDAVPLVLLTARAAAEDQVAGLETGCDTYLVKPFHPDVLEASVANLLAQRRRLRERFRLGEATPPTTTPDPRAALDKRLRPLVEADLVDPEFGPDKLAAAADLSYHQLYRALRDELGVTPSGFIRRVRVECAAELLRQDAGSVTEIAYSVGFESLSYFRRAFHERFDASPTKYLAAEPRLSGRR